MTPDSTPEFKVEQVVHYHILPLSETPSQTPPTIPHFPVQVGFTNLVVFHRPDPEHPHKIRTVPTYSTWLLKNNMDFTVIPTHKNKKRWTVILEEHLPVSFNAFPVNPIPL